MASDDKQVKSGNHQDARVSWYAYFAHCYPVPLSNKRYLARFFALAHEIAHNVTEEHNSDHEFWLAAICEAHVVALSQLLRPADTPSRPPHVSVQCFGFTAIMILFAYFVQRFAAAATGPR